mmetsp:Transcript_2251/g.4715  ORF Transcript_2251/g.4715 Transcript_2251/m.4715 type:complete len:224 (-) Transcript_2251:207-878(-)
MQRIASSLRLRREAATEEDIEADWRHAMETYTQRAVASPRWPAETKAGDEPRVGSSSGTTAPISTNAASAPLPSSQDLPAPFAAPFHRCISTSQAQLLAAATTPRVSGALPVKSSPVGQRSQSVPPLPFLSAEESSNTRKCRPSLALDTESSIADDDEMEKQMLIEDDPPPVCCRHPYAHNVLMGAAFGSCCIVMCTLVVLIVVQVCPGWSVGQGNDICGTAY